MIAPQATRKLYLFCHGILLVKCDVVWTSSWVTPERYPSACPDARREIMFYQHEAARLTSVKTDPQWMYSNFVVVLSRCLLVSLLFFHP